MVEKDFKLSDDEMDNIPTFGEQKTEALVPQIVNETSDRGAMAIIDRGRTLQQVKTPYVTAVSVQKPRDIGKVQESVLKEADLAGASFIYGWNVRDRNGKVTRIEGPSIDMAMCLVRNYGNCVLDTEYVETSTHFDFGAVLIDLESGTTIKRLFRQRRSQSISAKMDKDRAEDIVFQIGQSKAGRNVVVRAMPGWLIDQAIEAAKNGEVKRIDVRKLPETRQRAASFFLSHGVERNRIEKAIGKDMDKWMAEDIVELRGMMTALREGRATIDELFPTEGINQPKTSSHVDLPSFSFEDNKDPKIDQPKMEEMARQKIDVLQNNPPLNGEPESPPIEKRKPGRPKQEKSSEEKKVEPQTGSILPSRLGDPRFTELRVSGANPPQVVKPPDAQSEVFDPSEVKVGLIKCPVDGMRSGKMTHSRWCQGSCNKMTTCLALKVGPQPAV
jgi:hypothetical protein